jgi:hypothetical protein
LFRVQSSCSASSVALTQVFVKWSRRTSQVRGAPSELDVLSSRPKFSVLSSRRTISSRHAVVTAQRVAARARGVPPRPRLAGAWRADQLQPRHPRHMPPLSFHIAGTHVSLSFLSLLPHPSVSCPVLVRRSRGLLSPVHVTRSRRTSRVYVRCPAHTRSAHAAVTAHGPSFRAVVPARSPSLRAVGTAHCLSLRTAVSRRTFRGSVLPSRRTSQVYVLSSPESPSIRSGGTARDYFKSSRRAVRENVDAFLHSHSDPS